LRSIAAATVAPRCSGDDGCSRLNAQVLNDFKMRSGAHFPGGEPVVIDRPGAESVGLITYLVGGVYSVMRESWSKHQRKKILPQVLVNANIFLSCR